MSAVRSKVRPIYLTAVHSFLTTAVGERDGQFWTTPLERDNSTTEAQSHHDRFRVHLRVGLVWPEISGDINLYVAPKDLLSRGYEYLEQAAARNRSEESLFRQLGDPLAQAWPQPEGLYRSRYHLTKKANCVYAYVCLMCVCVCVCILSHAVFSEGGIAMCNPFMTERNYEELRERSTTSLFIPRPPQHREPPSMVARVFSPTGRFECNLSFADGGIRHTKQVERGEEEGPVTQIVFRLDTSGLYELQCTVKYYHTISRSVKERTWKKAVNVTLFKGTMHRNL